MSDDAAWKVFNAISEKGWCSHPCFNREGCGCADALGAAIAAERDACAKIAESFDMPAPGSAASTWLDCGRMRNEIAAAIRARGETQ